MSECQYISRQSQDVETETTSLLSGCNTVIDIILVESLSAFQFEPV